MLNEGKEGGSGYRFREDEQPYVDNLVSYCWNDEKDLENPEFLKYLKAFMEKVHALYPHVIAYHNAGEYFTRDAWRHYMTMCHPDMLMFADYPFTGKQPSPAYSEYYNRLAYFRDLALGALMAPISVPSRLRFIPRPLPNLRLSTCRLNRRFN